MMASTLPTMRHVATGLQSALRHTSVRCNRRQFVSKLRQSSFSTTAIAQERRYTKDHEWIDLPPSSNVGTVGISAYAAQALGDIVFVELPTIEEPFSAEDTIAGVESVKSASDIKAPIAGKLLEVNELLDQNPSAMGAKPEDDGAEGGWLARIEVSEEGLEEFKELMGEEEYKEYVKE